MDNGPLVSRGGGSDIICRTEAMAETKDEEEQKNHTKDERVQAELERRNKARTVSMRGFPKSLSRSRSGFIPREKEHYDPEEEDEEAKEVKDEAEEVEEEVEEAEDRNNKKDPKTKLGLLLTRSGGLDLAKRKRKILLRKKPQHATISSSSLSTPTSPSLYRFSSEDASLRKLATSSPPTSSSSPQFSSFTCSSPSSVPSFSFSPLKIAATEKTNSTSPTSSSISSSSSFSSSSTSISSSPSSPPLPSSPAQTSTTASCSAMGSNSGHFRRLKTAFQLAKTNHSKQSCSSSSPSSPRSARRTSKSMELKLNNNSTNIISSRDSNSNSPSTSPPSSPIRFSSSSTSAFSSSDPSSVISSSSSTKKERYSKRRSFPFPIFRSPFKDSSSNNSTHNRAVTRNQKVMSFRFAQIREEDLEVEPHPIACGAFGMVYKGKWLGTVECAIKKMVLPVPSSSTNSSTMTSSLSVLSPTPQPKTSPESRKKESQPEDAERDKEEKEKQKDEDNEAEDPLIQFKLEATLLEKVGRHPNVVTFYGALIQGHQVSLVMEYARLGSLHDLLHLPTGRSRPASSTYSPSATSPVLTHRHRQQQKHNQQGWGVPFPVLIKLLMEAANGILFLHHHQIIHRDIAARNVLVQGPYYTALITDFGLSRVVAQNCWGDVSKSGLGPVGHMAPEAITKQQYSEKSDAWSFGVMLWEVVARKKPWRGIPLLEVAKLVGTQGRSLPIPDEEDGRDEDEEEEEKQEERKKRCDPVLCGLMRRCFQRDPALRPSFQEIHRTLEDYYQALTEMRPPSPSLFFSNSSVALPVTSSNLRRKHHQQQSQRREEEEEEDDDGKEEDGEDELDLRGTSTSVATRQEIAKDGYVLQDWNVLEDDFEIAGKAQEEKMQVEKEKEETEMEKETERDLDEQEEMRSSMVMKRVAELEQRCRTRKESASYRLVRMKDTNTRNEENEQQNEEQSGEEKQKEERGNEEEKRKEERGEEGGEIEARKNKKVEMIKESKRRASTYDERSSKEKVSSWQRSAAPTTDNNSNNTSHTRRQKRILSCKATIGERQHLPGQ